MKNYIMINGKEIELTAEQIEGIKNAIGFETLMHEPSLNEEYFFIPDHNYIEFSSNYIKDNVNLERLKIGNLFPTEESAKLASQKDEIDLMFCHIKNYVARNNDGWRANWNDENQAKYYLCYNYDTDRWQVNRVFVQRGCDVLMSEKIAYRLVKILNKNVK